MGSSLSPKPAQRPQHRKKTGHGGSSEQTLYSSDSRPSAPAVTGAPAQSPLQGTVNTNKNSSLQNEMSRPPTPSFSPPPPDGEFLGHRASSEACGLMGCRKNKERIENRTESASGIVGNWRSGSAAAHEPGTGQGSSATVPCVHVWWEAGRGVGRAAFLPTLWLTASEKKKKKRKTKKELGSG